jgi:molybdenum cofactor cytidylyltransferase
VKFGQVPVEKAVGAVVAHSVRAGDAVVKKGTIISSEAATQLRRPALTRLPLRSLSPGRGMSGVASHVLAVGRSTRFGTPCSGLVTKGWSTDVMRVAAGSAMESETSCRDLPRADLMRWAPATA